MSLLVGACTRGADIHYKTYEFMAYTVFSNPGAQMAMVHSPYAAADGQEKLFNLFAESKHDYLLVMDCDVVPPSDAAKRMMAHDKQIVLAPVWYYDDDSNTIAYGAYHKWAENKKEEKAEKQRVPKTTGLEKVVSGGFGCMLVRKDVVKKFTDAKASFVKWDKMLGGHMQERASDNIFWAKCTILNIEAYIDWSIETTHYRSVGLSNKLVNDLRKAKK
jgi:hypothetical protein